MTVLLPQHQVSNPLTEDIMKEGLSLLCKTGNGLAHAFVKLELKEKELTDITLIQNFIHLRYVDLSENLIRDLSPLSSLTHLLWLKVDGNRLTSASMEELPYLQNASFANNHIKDTSGINHPRLASLNLKDTCAECVDVYGQSCEADMLGKAQNSIFYLEGLEGLGQLTTLHLRDNQLETLDGFSESMKSLQYLNIRGNGIKEIQELSKLQVLPMLRALVLLDNPCSDEGDYRIEVLVLLPRLERLDKDFFEEEERIEAEDIRQRRKEEELELEREREREKELEVSHIEEYSKRQQYSNCKGPIWDQVTLMFVIPSLINSGSVVLA
ncbi:hypothetical protein JD844_009912 [Phrynosoma platyrhinos]|uniref:Leucine rich repeat containing 23 n=1 Tax=Phrynosoma platyrhinos TaxID=52577 RepID=A0ABQ7TFQ5_PHRPL|nr:hypothetical protein JD844_009912 [Phrynosoma platyrhinos]